MKDDDGDANVKMDGRKDEVGGGGYNKVFRWPRAVAVKQNDGSHPPFLRRFIICCCAKKPLLLLCTHSSSTLFCSVQLSSILFEQTGELADTFPKRCQPPSFWLYIIS